MSTTQQAFAFRTWGGRRERAGRKPAGARAGVAHRPRARISERTAAHVTMRVVRELPGLRSRRGWQALRRAATVALRRADFRVVHAALLGNHVHLVVEADTPRALARGVQGLAISFARSFNARLRRRGKVFADRFHSDVIDTPLRARRTIAYVLNNWRRHRIDRGSRHGFDPFSSGWQFDGWSSPPDRAHASPPDGDTLPTIAPETWLLAVGWRRHGLVDPDEVPTRRPARAPRA